MVFSPYSLIVPIIFFVTVGFAVYVLRVPKSAEYSKLDRAGIVTNIILSILYVPISSVGIFGVFALDNPPEGAAGVTIKNLVSLGLCLPIVSLISIVFSIRFRRTGHSVLSFVLQFIPLILFVIMEIGFMTV